MAMIKRLMAFFIVLAVSLTSANMWSLTAYAAKVYTQNISNPSVSSNQIVTSSYIRNYTKGLSIYASSSLTFKNDGVVNVSGGSFSMTNEVYFENNETFTFTGTNATFSLGNKGTFVNNGTATIKGVYNFGVQSGASFINNGTLYLEDISYPNLTGFVNNGIIIIPDDAKNSTLHLALEGKNGENGQIYTQTDFENRKLRYLINYEGLNADDYWDFDNSANPTTYEWAAADPQDVTLADPTLPGYEFLGWTGLDVDEPTKNFTFSSNVCQEVTVTAHWKPIVYTITYDLDGGSFSVGQTPPSEYTRGKQEGVPSPYKNGYTFNGWIDADSGEQVSTASERYYYMPPSTLGNKTYQASFIANSDIQYNVICYYQNIDGTYEEASYLFTGETGAQVSVSSEKYDKEGFSFDEDHSGNILAGAIKADNSLKLKLYFNRNQYTVTFKSQDGSETLWTTEKYYDEKVGEYGGEIPSKASDDDLYEYVFDNWAREEPNRDFGYPVNDVVVSESITFYAAFEKVRDESIVVIKWERYEGFNAPAQTEIRLDRGADYTAELQLKNENYYVGTREWSLGFQEAHIYWYDVQTGEHGIEYTIDKENFEAPVILTIPDVQHDTLIKIKAGYHEEHDYSPADDEIIENGGCVSDSVIRHFCYKCGKTYDETVSAGGHVTYTFEKDQESHWKVCAICNEKIGLEAHTPDTGVITHEPTNTSTGTKTYSCTVCGYVTKFETIPALGGGSGNPSKPSIPSKPFEPSKPSEPIEPTEPVIPDEPVTPSRPENGIPFIKDDSEKNGWDVIKAEAENAVEGSTVTVDMNGTTVVPGAVIHSIAGRDVTLVFDMGDGITWSVNGKSVTGRKIGDIDFAVKKNAGTIPVDVINMLTGERSSIQIRLAHNGGFGFTAVLSINLGSENAGLIATLYFYNNGDPEFIDESEIAQDGTARLKFGHASDYLIVIGEKTDHDVEKSDTDDETADPDQPETDDKITPPSKSDENHTADSNPETGMAMQSWRMTLIGAMAAIVGVLSLKRKKSETK